MNNTPIALRPARTADAPEAADGRRTRWRDGHPGHAPDDLVRVRTAESFASHAAPRRATRRVGDMVVAVRDGAVAGS